MLSLRINLLLTISLALLAPLRAESVAQPGSAEAFHGKDTVCFLGDSITKGGLYPSYIELFYATRFPGNTPTFFNCGVGGDRASAMLKAQEFRIKTDVLGHQPTHVVLMLGMNDVDRNFYKIGLKDPDLDAKRNESLELYSRSVPQILQLLQSAGAEVILMTPSPYDETVQLADPSKLPLLGVNGALGKCAEKVRAWSAQYKTGLVEQYALLNGINQHRQHLDPAFSIIGAGQNWNDRVHPGPVGAFVMAFTFLKAQHHNPFVSLIEVDAAKGGAVASTCSAQISGIKCNELGIEFDCLEQALPMLVPENARAALALVPFEEELNQELLRVTGLGNGNYTLSIDGQGLGVFSHEQLNAGIDLASIPQTPQLQQSAKATEICEKLRLAGEQTREVATMRYSLASRGLDPVRDYAAVVTKNYEKEKATGRVGAWLQAQYREVTEPGVLEKEQAALAGQLRAVCIPKNHHFRLVKN